MRIGLDHLYLEKGMRSVQRAHTSEEYRAEVWDHVLHIFLQPSRKSDKRVGAYHTCSSAGGIDDKQIHSEKMMPLLLGGEKLRNLVPPMSGTSAEERVKAVCSVSEQPEERLSGASGNGWKLRGSYVASSGKRSSVLLPRLTMI